MSAQLIPLETRYNLDVRNVNRYATLTALGGAVANPVNGVVNPFSINLNPSTHVFVKHPRYFSNFLDYTFPTVFDNRILASEVKINGELKDSWTVFKTENYLDVDGHWGPINKLITHNDKVFFLQDRSIGLISVNPTAAVSSSVGPVNLGSGGILDSFGYLSTTSGTLHQWSVVTGHSGIYWLDILNKNFCRTNGSGILIISDTQGLSDWFLQLPDSLYTNDNPLLSHGVVSMSYNKNSEVLFNVLTPGLTTTLVYDEMADAFISFDSITPTGYMNNTAVLFSANFNNNALDIYSHYEGERGVLYGTSYDSYVTSIVNHSPLKTKVFDNLAFEFHGINSAGQQYLPGEFATLQVWNNYQNSGEITLVQGTNIKQVEREWQCAIPRNIVDPTVTNPDIFVDVDSTTTFKDRMRDKHLFVKLTWSNDTNIKQLLHYMKVLFRISER
jgi:hypothetical protein